MSAQRGVSEKVAASAHGLVREVADRLDIAGVKEALAVLESTGRRGQVSAEVTSAVPLTVRERSALEGRLRARYGHELGIAYHVDPDILGGLIVRVGDRYVDGSVAARLAQLRQTLVGAGG
jgi:F-type H+-transporting ATPase subunit delta